MNPFEMWVIYDKPAEFPDKVVARKWLFEGATDEMLIGESLEQIRSHLPQGLYRLGRVEGDEPHVLETWV